MQNVCPGGPTGNSRAQWAATPAEESQWHQRDCYRGIAFALAARPALSRQPAQSRSPHLLQRMKAEWGTSRSLKVAKHYRIIFHLSLKTANSKQQTSGVQGVQSSRRL